MAKRRGNGEGTIYYDKTRKKWAGYYTIDGKRKPIRGNTRKEVSEKLIDIQNSINKKTYIEKVNGEYDIKCAGLPDHCKELFRIGLKQGGDKNIKKEDFSKEEIEFLYDDEKLIERTLTDFKPGIKIPGKLSPKKIPGGVVLVETYYEMR